MVEFDWPTTLRTRARLSPFGAAQTSTRSSVSVARESNSGHNSVPDAIRSHNHSSYVDFRMPTYQLAVCKNCQNLHAKWGNGTPGQCAVCGHNNLAQLAQSDLKE